MANFDPNDPDQLKAATEFLNAPYTGGNDYESRNAEYQARLAALGIKDLPLTNPKETGATFGTTIVSEGALARLASPEVQDQITQLENAPQPPDINSFATTRELSEEETAALFADLDGENNLADEDVLEDDNDIIAPDEELGDDEALSIDEYEDFSEDDPIEEEFGDYTEDVDPANQDVDENFTAYPDESNGSTEPQDDLTTNSNTEISDSTKGNTQQKAFPTIPNPLHDFASYTYQLSLHALSESDYNRLTENDKDWVPTRTLIVSGGRRNNGPTSNDPRGSFVRDPLFQDDFYFSDFKMTTIVGLNNNKKSTNAVEISFTLFEPTGLTLLNRLVDLSADSGIGAKNYLEMPYLLQIDFHGYSDIAGAPGQSVQLLDQRKYIPIRITEMKIKVGINGAEYACKAIPFNHQAFNDTVSATPAHFEITAKNLEQFFENTTADQVKTQIERAESNKQELRQLEAQRAYAGITARDAQAVDTTIASKKEQMAKDGTYTITSYVAAYNAWQEAANKNKNTSSYNEIRVIFADEILANEGGTVVITEEQQAKKTPMANPADPKQVAAARRANSGAGNSGPDFTKGTFNIYMGTSVMEVINIAMRNTKYIRDQVVDPTQITGGPQSIADKQDKPLKWWKIVPHIKLKDFDKEKNKYSKIVTYHVQVHEFYNRKHPYGPVGMPKGWAKKYSYMYTGQNKDIIDFNIDFDTLYYTAINIDRGKSTATQSAKPGGTQEGELEATGPETTRPEFNSAMPVQREVVSGLPTADSAGEAKRDSKTQAVAGLSNDIYSGSRGDMINVKLKIIGDPTFIKQDDIFYNPGQAQYDANNKENPFLTPNGSVRTDNGEIHALLEFYSPTDRDESTGLLREGKWWRSLFSGIYRILTVESEFRQGKFEQSIDMIRLFNQTKEAGAPDDYDYETRKDKPNPERSSEQQAAAEENYDEPFPLGGEVPYDDTNPEFNTDEEDPDEDFNSSDDLEDEEPGDEPELLNPEDEAEFNNLDDDLEDADETDINEWDDEYSTDPEEDEAVLDDTDELPEPGSELVGRTQDDVDEALLEQQANADLSAEQRAELEAMSADLSSDDPVARQRGAEAFINGPATTLVDNSQQLVTFNEQYIATMKNGLNNPEFLAQATPAEIESVKQAIAESEANLPVMRQAAADARENLAKAKAEIAANRAALNTGTV